MNGQDSLKRFDLKTVAAASFDWQGARYTIRTAPASVFDAWVRQFVEEIEDVNTELWDIFDRWGIVKALLNEKFLILTQKNGSSVLRGRAELSISVNEQGMIDIPNAPILSGWANIVKATLQSSAPDEHPLPPVVPTGGRDYPDLEGE